MLTSALFQAVDRVQIHYLSDDALKELIASSDRILVVDVREEEEYQAEHIPGAKNVPASLFSANLFSAEERDSIILLHCKSGRRTRLPENVQKFLSLAGCKLYCMDGGIEQWKRCGLPILNQNDLSPSV